jgi:hypothetical protein
MKQCVWPSREQSTDSDGEAWWVPRMAGQAATRAPRRAWRPPGSGPPAAAAARTGGPGPGPGEQPARTLPACDSES